VTRYIPPMYTCACGKQAYGSRTSAKRVVKSMRRTGHTRVEGKRLNVYQCEPTGAWHVGNTAWPARVELGESA